MNPAAPPASWAQKHAASAAGLALLLLPACRDLSRFDTGTDGAFCGSIIDSDFTRSSGFPRGLELRLTIDAEALTSAPGTLTSRDSGEPGPCSPAPEFDRAPLRVTPQLFADPLSQLEFGSTRDHNFIAWVDSSCRGGVLAIVSLMQTGDVEVRLLAPGTAPGEGSPGEFGVFQLERTDCEL